MSFALERLEAVVATEMPPYVRACARAYIASLPMPPAPPVLTSPLTLATVRGATAPKLARVIVPSVVEADVRVGAIRARTPAWESYAELARARETVARERFGRGYLDMMHELAQARSPIAVDGGPAPVVSAWGAKDRVITDDAIEAMWGSLSRAYAIDERIARVTIARSDARPRTFVVDHDEVIVAIPRYVHAPAACFAVLHEFGHAIAALVAGPDLPRAVDEAVASHVARAMEDPDHAWHSEHAIDARHRRRALAIQLDAVERDPARGYDLAATPPWALWNDGAAQAAYVTAEALADSLDGDPATIADRIATIDLARPR